MKKVIFFLVTLFAFSFLDATCAYSDVKDLNAISNYVDYSYKYNSNSKIFNIKLINVTNELFIRYKSNNLYSSNGEVLIENIKPGNSVSLKIYSTGRCDKELLRIMNISLPYVNKYFNSKECENYKQLSVCNQEFLDYNVTSDIFYKEIENIDNIIINKIDKPNEGVKRNAIINFFLKYYIQIILVIVSSLISYFIFSSKLRKVKHGI